MKLTLRVAEPRYYAWLHFDAVPFHFGFCWVAPDGRRWYRRAWFYCGRNAPEESTSP
jgi:hypothetical protein